MRLKGRLKAFGVRFKKNYELVDQALDKIVAGICTALISDSIKGQDPLTISTFDEESLIDDKEIIGIKAKTTVKIPSVQMPKSQYKEHPFSSSSTNDVINESVNSHITKSLEVPPVINSNNLTEGRTKIDIHTSENLNYRSLDIESIEENDPDYILIPNGSRVIKIFVLGGEVIKKVYVTPYGNTLTLKGNYKEQLKELVVLQG